MRVTRELDWAAIRLAYLESAETVDQIAQHFDIPLRLIYLVRQLEGWPKRSEVRGPASGARYGGALIGEAPPAPPPISRVKRDRLIKRLCNAIDLKIDIMEKGMQADDAPAPTAADVERGARDIASLVRSIDTLTEFTTDRPQSQPGGGAKTAGAGGSGGADATGLAGASTGGNADDDDRFRRALAERIARFRRARREQPDA